MTRLRIEPRGNRKKLLTLTCARTLDLDLYHNGCSSDRSTKGIVATTADGFFYLPNRAHGLLNSYTLLISSFSLFHFSIKPNSPKMDSNARALNSDGHLLDAPLPSYFTPVVVLLLASLFSVIKSRVKGLSMSHSMGSLTRTMRLLKRDG
jgi:hypothetical protein